MTPGISAVPAWAPRLCPSGSQVTCRNQILHAWLCVQCLGAGGGASTVRTFRVLSDCEWHSPGYCKTQKRSSSQEQTLQSSHFSWKYRRTTNPAGTLGAWTATQVTVAAQFHVANLV